MTNPTIEQARNGKFYVFAQLKPGEMNYAQYLTPDGWTLIAHYFATREEAQATIEKFPMVDLLTILCQNPDTPRREDLKLAMLAMLHGWVILFTKEDSDAGRTEIAGPRFPHDSIQFRRGNLRIWQTETSWNRAQLVDMHWAHHTRCDKLRDLILASD